MATYLNSQHFPEESNIEPDQIMESEDEEAQLNQPNRPIVPSTNSSENSINDVRSRKRTRDSDGSGKPRRKYSKTDVANALVEVRAQRMSLAQAANQFNIPVSTLYMKKNGLSTLETKYGPPPTLGVELEKKIVKKLVTRMRVGYPLNKKTLLDCVQMMVKRLKIKNNFKKNDRPGDKFYRLFMKRHGKILKEKKCGVLSKGRASVTRSSITEWHANLMPYFEDYFKEHFPESWEAELREFLSDGRRHFNGDEINFLFFQLTGRYIGVVSETLTIAAEGPEKANVGVFVVFNAAAEVLPPTIIFAGARMTADMKREFPLDWWYVFTKSGWQKSASFVKCVTSIFEWAKENGVKFPIVLYVDGHSTHVSEEVSYFCEENAIILILLPPNCTHILQPADLLLFAIMKLFWRQFQDNRRAMNPGAVGTTKATFAKELKEFVFSRITPDVCKKSFLKSGLWPINVNNIDFSKCFADALEATHLQTLQPAQRQLMTQQDRAALIALERDIPQEVLHLFRVDKQGNTFSLGAEYRKLFFCWCNIVDRIENVRQDYGGDGAVSERIEQGDDESQSEVNEQATTPIDENAPEPRRNVPELPPPTRIGPVSNSAPTRVHALPAPTLRDRLIAKMKTKFYQHVKSPSQIGLINIGRTCYINVVLQFISAIPEFLIELEELSKGSSDKEGEQYIAHHLHDFFYHRAKLTFPQMHAALVDFHLNFMLLRPEFVVNKDHDAAEYFINLMNFTPIQGAADTFYHEGYKEVACHACEVAVPESKQSDSILELCIPVDTPDAGVAIDIQQLMKIQPSTQSCAKCGAKMKNRRILCYVPSSLIVTVGRTQWDKENQRSIKKRTPIKGYNEVNMPAVDPKGEQFSVSYQPLAVVYHDGDSSECGHYVVSVNRGTAEQPIWFLYDDHKVEELPESPPVHRLLRDSNTCMVMYGQKQKFAGLSTTLYEMLLLNPNNNADAVIVNTESAESSGATACMITNQDDVDPENLSAPLQAASGNVECGADRSVSAPPQTAHQAPGLGRRPKRACRPPSRLMDYCGLLKQAEPAPPPSSLATHRLAVSQEPEISVEPTAPPLPQHPGTDHSGVEEESGNPSEQECAAAPPTSEASREHETSAAETCPSPLVPVVIAGPVQITALPAGPLENTAPPDRRPTRVRRLPARLNDTVGHSQIRGRRQRARQVEHPAATENSTNEMRQEPIPEEDEMSCEAQTEGNTLLDNSSQDVASVDQATPQSATESLRSQSSMARSAAVNSAIKLPPPNALKPKRKVRRRISYVVSDPDFREENYPNSSRSHHDE